MKKFQGEINLNSDRGFKVKKKIRTVPPFISS